MDPHFLFFTFLTYAYKATLNILFKVSDRYLLLVTVLNPDKRFLECKNAKFVFFVFNLNFTLHYFLSIYAAYNKSIVGHLIY